MTAKIYVKIPLLSPETVDKIISTYFFLLCITKLIKSPINLLKILL